MIIPLTLRWACWSLLLAPSCRCSSSIDFSGRDRLSLWSLFVVQRYHHRHCLRRSRLSIECTRRPAATFAQVWSQRKEKRKIIFAAYLSHSLIHFQCYSTKDAAVNRILWLFSKSITACRMRHHVCPNICWKTGIDIIPWNYPNYGQRSAHLLLWHSPRPSLIAPNYCSEHNLELLAMMAFESTRACVDPRVHVCVFCLCSLYFHCSWVSRRHKQESILLSLI